MSQKGTGDKSKKSPPNTKKLLEKRGITRREYQKKIATLKKQGVVAKYIDARTHKPTRYMLSKIKKYQDVASGHAHAVKARDLAASVREKYRDKGIVEERGKFFIVPKTQAQQRAKVVKGQIALYTALKNGEHRVIFLPYSVKDMNELVKVLRDNGSEINAMKEPTEQFGFQVYGNNSLDGFPHAEDMATYITDHYQHILNSSRFSRDVMDKLNFVLLRFKSNRGMPTAKPYMGERISHKPKKSERPESAFEARYRKRYAAGKKERQRKKETPEQKAKRLEYQREYYRKHKDK